MSAQRLRVRVRLLREMPPLNNDLHATANSAAPRGILAGSFIPAPLIHTPNKYCEGTPGTRVGAPFLAPLREPAGSLSGLAVR